MCISSTLGFMQRLSNESISSVSMQVSTDHRNSDTSINTSPGVTPLPISTLQQQQSQQAMSPLQRQQQLYQVMSPLQQQQKLQQAMSPMQSIRMNDALTPSSNISSPSMEIQIPQSNLSTPMFGTSPLKPDDHLDYG